jgi:HD-GYP domain-containing protein (c-di-GMP phosphodiesterase class II)
VTNTIAEATSVARAESRRFVLLCGLAPAILTVALVVYRPDFVAQIDYRAYDILVRSNPTKPPDGRVAIVDIDDRSLSTIGQWPWRRERIAQLIGRLREQGAAVIALDVIFAEADRYDAGGKEPSPWDASLAQALLEGRIVLGYALTFTGADGDRRDCVLHPLAVPIVQPQDGGATAPLFRADGAICSLPALARAAGRSGFLNAVPDFDGILRRVPLVIDYEGNTYPGLALAAVLAATGAKPIALRARNQITTSLELTTGTIPLDGRSNMLVRYRGPKRAFPYASAADVLAGRDTRNVFKDAVVFVGTTALGSREVVSTPLDRRFAGVEVQATVADNLLRQDFLSRTEHALTLEVIMVLALGIAVTLLVARVGLPVGTIAATVLLVAIWFAMRWQLAAKGEYLSPVFPIIGMMASLGAATLARIAQERRRADRAGHDTDMAQRLMVRSLLSLTEVRDADTGRHSRRIQQYSRLLAEELSQHPAFRDYLTPEHIDLLASLAPLHDIGKVGVSDHLLHKEGELTPDEYQEMKKHPSYGLDVINNAQRDVGASENQILSMAKDIVYTHHEWWNGKGYPRGIKGTAIPVAGRLVAVVDVYDALTARRRYRQPVSHEEAVHLIVAGRGTHFDPDVVDAFVRAARRFEWALTGVQLSVVP